MAASTMESPTTLSRNSEPSPTSSRGSGNTSSTASSARIGPPAAMRPSTGTKVGSGSASEPATSVSTGGLEVSSAERTSPARGRFGSRRRYPFFASVRNWWPTDEVDVRPTASPISRMLGGYPRLVTDARITSRMVRWRGVSVDSADRKGRSESASGVSLSLIRPNVAPLRRDIKHVFEVCRVLLVQGSSKPVGAPFYRLRRVQQFDHMFGIRTHYRLCFEQVIDYKPTGGTHMMPTEMISPSAPIRLRPIQVRPPARRGGHRGPQPCRPVAASPRYRGTGVLMSTASHRPRPITPATTVALAMVAAGITVWLGVVAHFGGMFHAAPEQAAVQMPART